MTGHPEISVVVPSFNYGRYLGDCLRSIFGQVDAPDYEIVVVDDGSTDDTRDVLAAFADARLTVVRQDNGGHASAINAGLPLTRGAIVARIDPDDRYKPHFLATAWRTLRDHPDAALVYGRAQLIDSLGRPSVLTSSEPHRGDFQGSEFVRLLEKNFICAPTVAARRSAWLAHTPVPDHLAFHDWYFTVLIARDHPVCFVDDVLADYRVHDANHHTAVARNGSEERSVLWLLDRIFATSERDSSVQAAKMRARRRIYAAHYLDFADKYFGFGMKHEARRCYLAALRQRPTWIARPDLVRRFLGTVIGLEAYERAKQTWKAVSHS